MKYKNVLLDPGGGIISKGNDVGIEAFKKIYIGIEKCLYENKRISAQFQMCISKVFIHGLYKGLVAATIPGLYGTFLGGPFFLPLNFFVTRFCFT